jgi:hypothetical protein
MDSNKMMHAMRKRLFPAVLIGLALAGSAAAQIPFQLQYTQGATISVVPNDSVLTLAAPLGQSQTLLMRATYSGTGSVTVTQAPFLSGAGSFSAAINQSLPLTLQTGQSFQFSVRFAPSTPAVDTARLTIAFAETPASTVSPITLSLQGVTSAIVVSYVLPADNNVVPLQGGDSIPFAETLVGGSSSAALNLTNIGASLGQITRVSLSGSAFRLQGLPLFPATVLGGQNLQIQILYRPTATGPSTGTVTVEIAGANPVTIGLQGNAVAPSLTYQVGNPPVAVAAGGTITLPGADLGQSTTSLVRITNTGSGAATISTLSAIGTGFLITSAPTLPQTLAPNTSLIFTVSFAPARTGLHTGTLAVNSDVFNLSGNGTGAALSFSYVSGGTTVTLGTGNNSIIFSPVRITESAQVGLDIKNTGAVPVILQNIGIGQTNTPYSIATPLALPVTIAANGTLRVNVKFEPTTVGFASATLVVDNTILNLNGSGTQPPALPAYTFSGPSGTVAPLAQPTVGLKLAAPYPVALTGVLTLDVATGNLPADPAVQFATGGRTVAFRIPANTTDAVFGAQGTLVGLQSGTAAGTIKLTPSFATLAGNVDLTPAAPAVSQFTVSAAAPTVLSVQVVNVTNTGLTVQVTGFSTSRTLTAANIQFTTASGYKMATSQFALDLKAIAAAWFQSTGSLPFGGQFRISIPFNFQFPLTTGQTVLTGISAVSVTVANETGSSTALQARTQ